MRSHWHHLRKRDAKDEILRPMSTYLDLASSAWVTGQLGTFRLFSRWPGRLYGRSRLGGEIVGIKIGGDAVHGLLQ